MMSALLLAAALVAAQPGSDATPPASLSEIAITANGARSENVTGEESAASCARFRVDAAGVTAFFFAARRVESRDFYHDLDMSRCHAAGTAKLNGLDPVGWFIDAAGRGALTFVSGAVAYFHRPDPEDGPRAD